MTMAAAMAAIGAKTLPKYAPKSFSIWGAQINPASILGDNDIPDGSVLALTKMDGGGGACSGP